MSKKPTYKELEKLTQELKRREVYYRLISENSTDMISKHDSNGIYTYASSSCQDLIGYTSDELIGRSAYVIFHYDDLKKMKNSHQEIFLTNIAHTVSYQIKHKQGHYIYVETTSKAIRNYKSGNIEEIIAITRGITDRKRTEKVLKEQTITLTDILERAGDGICVCHNITDWPHVRFTVWNPRMVEITGYTMQEINQLGWYQTMYPDPDIQQRVINRMERMRVGEDILAEEWCVNTKDNHQKILSISTTVLTIENGKIHVLAVMQDITERKKAEDELRKSEFKYRDIFENVSDFLYFHDLKGYFVETNFASKEITGYNEGDLTKMKIMDLIPERYKHLFDEYLKEMITKGKSEGLLTVLAKNGNEHVLEYKNSLIFDSTGPIGVRGIARDVTERRQAEKKILQAKQEWEKTFNAVPDLIAILDNNYRIIRVNKAMADRLGMLPDCAVGLNCYKYIHGTNEPPLYCPHTKLLADGKEHSVEVNEKRLNGDFWVTDSPLQDSAGHLIGSVHVARDITESKKDKELLRKSEEKYRNLIEKLDDIIWVADLNLCTTYVSTSIEKQLGFTPEERLAQEFKEQVTPSSYRRVLEILAHELERDQDENTDPNRIARIEIEYYHKNGSTKWLETIASGVRDKKGSLVGVHGLSRNITDRKYAEMEKEQLEAQLRQSQKMESIY